MTDRLMQALLVGLALASFGLFFLRRPALKDQALIFDETGATKVADALVRGELRAYSFQAYAGQELRATVNSSPGAAVFQLLRPGLFGSRLPGADADDSAQTWQGVLPRTGTYRILVCSASGDAEFTLRVFLAH
jgi:hypothetical protein